MSILNGYYYDYLNNFLEYLSVKIYMMVLIRGIGNFGYGNFFFYI